MCAVPCANIQYVYLWLALFCDVASMYYFSDLIGQAWAVSGGQSDASGNLRVSSPPRWAMPAAPHPMPTTRRCAQVTHLLMTYTHTYSYTHTNKQTLINPHTHSLRHTHAHIHHLYTRTHTLSLLHTYMPQASNVNLVNSKQH